VLRQPFSLFSIAMKYDLRKATRQYLILLTILLCSLLLITCLGSDEQGGNHQTFSDGDQSQVPSKPYRENSGVE
jgi:hypothetical protein